MSPFTSLHASKMNQTTSTLKMGKREKRTNTLNKLSIMRYLQTVLQCCLKKKKQLLIGGWDSKSYA